MKRIINKAVVALAVFMFCWMSGGAFAADLYDQFDNYQPSLWSNEQGGIDSGIYTLSGVNVLLKTTSVSTFAYYTLETRFKSSKKIVI